MESSCALIVFSRRNFCSMCSSLVWVRRAISRHSRDPLTAPEDAAVAMEPHQLLDFFQGKTQLLTSAG